MELRVLTFNIQHCRNINTGKIDYDAISREIASFSPDIVALQEVRGKCFLPEFKDQAGIIAKKLGMNYVFGRSVRIAGVGPFGNAILTKYPIISQKVIKIPFKKWIFRIIQRIRHRHTHIEPRSILEVCIDVRGERVNVYTTHFGFTLDEQKAAVKTVMKSVRGEKSIIMGDFNLPQTALTLKPLFDTFNTATLGRTFPSQNPGRQIDYILTSRNIEISAAGVSERAVSDHRACFADVKYY